MILGQIPKLMGDQADIAAPKSIVLPQKSPRVKPAWFFLAAGVLSLCFFVPLRDLLHLAMSDDLYSDIPLIPIVSLYLLWQKKEKLPYFSRPSWGIAALFFVAGLLVMAAYGLAASFIQFAVPDYLAINLFAFLLCLMGVCFALLGGEFVRAAAFPLGMLAFMIPLPEFVRQGAETFLQYGSAMVAELFFTISGMPSDRDGILFHLPGINLQVAPECSGIHSSMVLLILSLVAGYLCLRSSRCRWLLALAVIPLGLIRNGFRIFVIGQLCVRDGAQMLDSPIHRHGGPLFFVLSLILFFPLLLLLRKMERTDPKP
ncbi:MAG TPA: exosortase/archaeosortase family protein [Verrucomicrobiae bacterium]|jgi:exosortase C (VPDSG-CTERM-specific)